MRPIDADAFAKRAYEVAYPVVHGINDHERGLTLTGIAQLLDEAPTVEPKCADGCLYEFGSDECEGCLFTTVKAKRGRWIENAETYYTAINEKGGGVDENTPYFTDDIACSECLAKFSTIDNCTEKFVFCPNCGARMESENETD